MNKDCKVLFLLNSFIKIHVLIKEFSKNKKRESLSKYLML